MITLMTFVTILHKHMYMNSPVDTGNLRDRGLIKQQFGPRDAGVILGGRDAPYGPITTLPWTHPRWRGKKNPNEGWATRAALAAAEEIASITGGRIL